MTRLRSSQKRSHQNSAQNTVVLSFYIYRCFVCFLLRDEEMNGRSYGRHTISTSTSPAAKASPSFIFHDAIPPSDMVGDMAGMRNAATACLKDDEWSSKWVGKRMRICNEQRTSGGRHGGLQRPWEQHRRNGGLERTRRYGHVTVSRRARNARSGLLFMTPRGTVLSMRYLLHFLRSFGRRCFLHFGLYVFSLFLFSAIPPTFFPVTAQPIKFASFLSPASLLPLCFIRRSPSTRLTNHSRCLCLTLSPREILFLLFMLIPTCRICGLVMITSNYTKTPCLGSNVALAVRFALSSSSYRVQSWTTPVQ